MQKKDRSKLTEIYCYDYLIEKVYNLIKKELSEEDFKLIQKYDRETVRVSMDSDIKRVLN